MPDETIPQPTGGAVLSPITPTPRQDALCKKLDDWHVKNGLKTRPSDMLRGALFAARVELRDNSDWLAQAANSLREILYPLWGKISNISERKEEALKKFGSVRVSEALIQGVERVYGLLNDLTHHGCDPKWLPKYNKDFETFTITDYETLLDDFEKVMFDALDRQLDIHNEIDDVNREMSGILSMVEVASPEELKPIT